MIMESLNFQFADEQPWVDIDLGVQRQIMAYNDSLMLVKVRFEPGAKGAPHAHPHTQATYVESGKFEFTTDGQTRIIKAGDGVYIKPNALHDCKCIDAGVLIDTFSPMREDFL